MFKKATSIAMILLLLFTLSPGMVTAEENKDKTPTTPTTPKTPTNPNSPDPRLILTDPSFDLNTVDPALLEAWYNSSVNVPDANLKKALMSAANVPSGQTLTIEKMFSLPGNLNFAGLSISNLTGMEYAINVKHLSLGNNTIVSLDPLKNLYNIEYLDYSNNQVSAVPSWVFTSRKLTVVNGSSNKSMIVASPNGSDSVLEELYLEGNQLSSLPNLSGCKKLVSLSLANNAFVNFPETILTLTELDTFSITKNKIAQIPDIASLAKLTTLNLDYNELTAIPAGIDKLTSLQQLSISNNKITAIPDSILSMNALQMLILNFNSIQTLPEGLSSMSGLKVLGIAVNDIDLTASDGVITKLKDKLSTFYYKIQKPNFKLELLKDKEAPGGKLVWSNIQNISDAEEGYTNITKFVIERKEETISEEGETDDEENDPGVLPTLSVFAPIAELDAEAREYIDETADPDKNYTYRVTAYITGMFMENSPIDTSGFETVNTKDITGSKYDTQDFIIFGAIALGGILIIAGLILIIVKKSKNRSPKAKPKSKPKKRKIKKITKSSSAGKRDTEIIEHLDDDIL